MYIVLLEIKFERGNQMIEITTKNVNEKDFEAHVNITGSGKEIIRDFYSLHNAIKRDFSMELLHEIAVKKWESEHEDN